MAPATDLVTAIRRTLALRADPERGAAQRAYMKSDLPFWGIPLPELRRVVKQPLLDHPLATRAEWERAIRSLWDEATHREERYAALAVARHRPYAGWRLEPATLALAEHLVVTGRWWDVCDETAQHLVAPLVAAHRAELAPVMLAWSRADDPWLRRVAVQCQLGQKAATDPSLLAAVIEPNVADPSFWLRKAIGWALREYSAQDPDWVRAFVAAHPDLSGLSRREALRKIDA